MTPANSRDKILEKIALISKMQGAGSNASQGELNNAASLIQSLMDKYSISQQEVEMATLTQETEEVIERFRQASSEYTVNNLMQWHWELAGIIARITHTKNYFTTWKKGKQGMPKFFGSERNADIAAALFVEWISIIMAMCESAIDDHWQYLIKKYDYKGFLATKKAMGFGREYSFMEVVVPEFDRTTYFKSSWYQGCLRGIAAAVREQEDRREQTTQNALVVYHENLDIQYREFSRAQNMRSTNHRVPKKHSDVGYKQGFETGKKIRIGSEKIGN